MVVVNVINELLIELPLFKLMLLGIIHLKMKMENQYRSFFFIQLVFRQYHWVRHPKSSCCPAEVWPAVPVRPHSPGTMDDPH